LALLAMPHKPFKLALIVTAVQFLLFRISDIIKPPPARQLERLPDGQIAVNCDADRYIARAVILAYLVKLILQICTHLQKMSEAPSK